MTRERRGVRGVILGADASVDGEEGEGKERVELHGCGRGGYAEEEAKARQENESWVGGQRRVGPYIRCMRERSEL